MARPPRTVPIGPCVPATLEDRVEELVNHFKREAAEDQARADRGVVEASYYYGLAAAFEVVAAMLREALSQVRKGRVDR
jgi:predicted outer membrane lipoprotein